jgi:serine/threonine protein kinase
MSLPAKTRLGPYEIVEALAAGGMGEVYRTRDTRLGRDVALKTLLAEVAGDAARQQLFEKEARALAALNHPNIVSVFDVGAEDGVSYIVSELVDGESLRKSHFDLRETVNIAVQIASGLAAAHSAGIIHRDLKPENILVTRDGRVKILDFGLAKLHLKEVGAVASTQTLDVATGPGAVVGTIGYMSPEQVRGLAVTERSDLFSFGVVLYEMATGERPFQGNSAMAVCKLLHWPKLAWGRLLAPALR